MTKKILALLVAMSMIIAVCPLSILAEETVDYADAMEATGDSEEGETTAPTEDDEKKASVELDIDNSYLPNATVLITGTVTGDVSVLDIEIVCDEDRVEESVTISVSKFESNGVTHKLDDATVGAEYTVNVYDNDTTELIGTDSFLIRKASTGSDKEDDGSNKVTFWVEGLTERYVEETVVNLSVLDEATVFDLAEYVLEDLDRNYKDNKDKITAIASTATGSTYTLKDNSTTKAYEDCVWGFFLNGYANYEEDWTQVDLKGGDEVVLYYGVPGEVGYPVVTLNGEEDFEKVEIGVKDELTFVIQSRTVDPETGEESVDVIDEKNITKPKLYLIKRGTTAKGSAKTADADGEIVFKSSTVTSSWITSYQGGKVLVSGYQTSSKPLKMVSVTRELFTDREGAIQAYVRIEGAHKTLLSRTKSAKIEEYDLYNFMLEVLEDEDIEYEVNDDETNFTYFESKTTSGYSNENGDITRDSGWYAVVNDEVYTPEDNLEDVVVYANDEILFYFGDEDTVPVVYYKVDGDLKTGKKVYVYFYSDAEMTDPIDDFDVYFDGEDYNDKRLNTNSDGRVTLPTVDYKGEYKLYWGEQVSVKSDECPVAVYGEVELNYTGTSNSTGTGTGTTTVKYECEYCGDFVTKVYEVEYKGEELDVCSACRTELKAKEEATEKDTDWPTEKKTEEDTEDDTWDPTDFKTDMPTDTSQLPEQGGTPQSYLYPDTNFDWWAVPYVEKAHEYDLMKGTTYGYFEPLRDITRAEFTTIVCRILGLDTTAANYTQKFDDVKSTDWHYGYIMAAHEAGFVSGKSATTFNPNDYITREEIAVLIARIINVPGNVADVEKYVDSSMISGWAKEGVAAVNMAGIMTGDQFGQFSPKSNVNRQTVAAIAVRLYDYLRD